MYSFQKILLPVNLSFIIEQNNNVKKPTGNLMEFLT